MKIGELGQIKEALGWGFSCIFSRNNPLTLGFGFDFKLDRVLPAVDFCITKISEWWFLIIFGITPENKNLLMENAAFHFRFIVASNIHGVI